MQVEDISDQVMVDQLHGLADQNHGYINFNDLHRQHSLFYNISLNRMAALITFISQQLENPRKIALTTSQSPSTENLIDIYYISQKDYFSTINEYYFPRQNIASYDIEYLIEVWRKKGYIIPYYLNPRRESTEKIIYSPYVSNYLRGNQSRNSTMVAIKELHSIIKQIFDFSSYNNISELTGIYDARSGFLLFSFYLSILRKWQETNGVDIDSHFIHLDRWYTIGPDIVTIKFKKYELDSWSNLEKLISSGLLTIGDRQQGYYLTQRGI